jgi:hypothetical protein
VGSVGAKSSAAGAAGASSKAATVGTVMGLGLTVLSAIAASRESTPAPDSAAAAAAQQQMINAEAANILNEANAMMPAQAPASGQPDANATLSALLDNTPSDASTSQIGALLGGDPPAKPPAPKSCSGPVPPSTGTTASQPATFAPGISLWCTVSNEDPCSPSQTITLYAQNQTAQPLAVELNWTVVANVPTQPHYAKAPNVNPNMSPMIDSVEIGLNQGLGTTVMARGSTCSFQNVRVGTLPGPAGDTATMSTYVTPNWGPYMNSSVGLPTLPTAPDTVNDINVPSSLQFPGSNP